MWPYVFEGERVMTYIYEERFVVVEYTTRLPFGKFLTYQDAVDFICGYEGPETKFQIDKVWVRSWK